MVRTIVGACGQRDLRVLKIHNINPRATTKYTAVCNTYPVIRETVAILIKVTGPTRGCIRAYGLTHGLVVASLLYNIVAVNGTPNIEAMRMVGGDDDQRVFVFAVVLMK